MGFGMAHRQTMPRNHQFLFARTMLHSSIAHCHVASIASMLAQMNAD
jgi:hypothetical protein